MTLAPSDSRGVELDWREIFSRIDEGVILIGADGLIRFANEACTGLFDLPGPVVGQTIETALSEPSVTELAKTAFSSEATQTSEITIVRESGIRSLLARGSRYVDSAAAAPGALLVFSDITKQRDLEDVSTDFVAIVSHELRTPVSILAGYIENLADFPKMPRIEQVEIFGIMQEHATRLKSLLDDLLTVACFESHSDILDYADLDLHKFLRRLAKDWQPALASKGMAVLLEIPEEAQSIRVDKFRFEQVMHNLFDNAFKYTPIDGQIRVRALLVDQAIEITVEDNGAGIPEEDLPHIFERFYRVDKARSRQYGGTGLGLSIVKHIIELHGGTVRAESTMGMSTRVIISLPRTGGAA